MTNADFNRLKENISLSVDSHSRLSEYSRLVYPVVSRRAKGLSLGINLNLDKRCSYNCVYCQVDRSITNPTLDVSLDQIDKELTEWFEEIKTNNGSYEGYSLRDISIAGDGEPTHVGVLHDVISLIIRKKKQYGFTEAKIVLLTNGSNIRRKDLMGLWEDYFNNQGDIWFKLDFWDEESFRRINRTSVKYEMIIKNLLWISQQYPIIIQSCFFRWRDEQFTEDKYNGYIRLVQTLLKEKAKIKLIQAYTLARSPAEDVFPWDNQTMDRVKESLVKAINIPVEVYYGQVAMT